MATITPVSTSTAGATLTYASAAGGGDTIACSGRTGVKLLVRNGGSSITVTLAGAISCSQGSTHDTVITVGGSTDKEITIPAQCINATTGNVAVAYSTSSSVTLAAISD